MKSFGILLPAMLILMQACTVDPSSSNGERLSQGGTKTDRDAGSAGMYSMGGTSTANPPIKPGETSAAYRDRLERQQRESLPDARVLYQNSSSDAFGRTTNTGIYQQRGGVIQETHIGNQRVYPGQSVYPPASYNGVVQPGYVPSGTAAVYDPVTGRVIPVRRR